MIVLGKNELLSNGPHMQWIAYYTRVNLLFIGGQNLNFITEELIQQQSLFSNIIG